MNTITRPERIIRGCVRAEDGEPISGALVMGLDLGYAETDERGGFLIRNPEMALTFWCNGFYPATLLINGSDYVKVHLRAVKRKTNSQQV